MPAPPNPPPYELMIADEQWTQIEALPQESQRERAIAFLMKYVCQTPRRRLPNGDLKELKGEHQGYWQYDIDRRYRLIYSIEENEKKIYVRYVGMHPTWGRKSSGGGRLSS